MRYKMLICIFLVYEVEIAINKSLFLLDHKENWILDNHLDVYEVEIAINKSLFLLDHKENWILDNHLD